MAKRYRDVVIRNRYMSGRMGQLLVADCREVFPGDKISYNCNIGVHMSPMQAPELAPIYIRQDTFFVPNRINWNYWDNYISQKLLENDAVDLSMDNVLIPPQITIAFGSAFNMSDGNSRHMTNVRGLYDVLEGLGLKLSYMDSTPPASNAPALTRMLGSTLNVSAFPLMAYWRIWHDYYRDAYLQNDQFTAYGRFPQFGDPWADESPLTDVQLADVKEAWSSPFASVEPGLRNGSLNGYYVEPANAAYPFQNYYKGVFTYAQRQPIPSVMVFDTSPTDSRVVLPGTAFVLLADRGGVNPTNRSVIEPTGSIGCCAPVCMPKDYFFSMRQSPVYNQDVEVPGSMLDLRKAFQVLGYREKVNRFDNRIKAWMYNMWHVNISDKRCNNPIWLGGTQNIFNTQEILGTVNNADTVLGQLGGFGVGSVRSRSRKLFSEEHGFLITVFYISVLPVYGDGLQRFWLRGRVNVGTRIPTSDGALDWPLPDFARIGQQAVDSCELSIIPSTFVNTTFGKTAGYQDRFSDTLFSSSDVCGDFRTILRFWHTGLFFGTKDANQTFSPADDDLPAFKGVSGDFVSLYSRLQNNLRLSRTGNMLSGISSNLSARLFDAGLTADQFWIVVNSTMRLSRRLPAHSHPGYADHTSKVV